MEEEGEEINPSKGKIQKEDAWMDNDEREILATTELRFMPAAAESARQYLLSTRSLRAFDPLEHGYEA
jgi:hypothetical protein